MVWTVATRANDAKIVRAVLARHPSLREQINEPFGWTLHGSLNSWEKERGNYPAVAQELLAAGAVLPKREAPWEGSDDVLRVLDEHAAKG